MKYNKRKGYVIGKNAKGNQIVTDWRGMRRRDKKNKNKCNT